MKKTLLLIFLLGLMNLNLHGQDDFYQLEKWLQSSSNDNDIRLLLDSITKKEIAHDGFQLGSNLVKSIILKDLGQQKQAAELLHNGLLISRSENDRVMEMKYEYYLGEITNETYGQEFYHSSLEKANELDDEFYKCRTQYKLGNYYYSLHRNESPPNDSINNLDLSVLYYTEALRISKEINLKEFTAKSLSSISNTYLDKSGAYDGDGDGDINNDFLKKSDIYRDSSYRLYQELSDSISVARVHLNNVSALIIRGEYFDAEQETNKALKYLKPDNYWEKSLGYYNYSLILDTLERYKEALVSFDKAYNNLENYYITDFHERDEKIARSNAILNMYENQADKAIEKQGVAIRRSKILTLALLSVLSFFTLIFLVFYKNVKLKRENLELALRTTHLEKEKELQAHESKMRDKIISTAFEAKEAERKEVSEFLHNSISAMLSSANLHLHTLKKYDISTVPELVKAKSLIGKAGDEVRKLSHQLVSPILLKFGLEHAIIDQTELLSSTKLVFKVTSNLGDNRYSEKVESKIYLVTIEFCQNVIKHSKATKTDIFLLEKDGYISTTVIDNGIGLVKSSILEESVGLGLGQIKSLAHALNGEYEIKSNKNTTEARFKIPIDEIEE